jgi:hypothetical protein
MADCLCGTGLGNLGLSSCVVNRNVTNKLFFVPVYDSTGVKNKLDLTGTINEATIIALINQSDASKRWYLSPVFENVVKATADTTFEEAPSQRKKRIKAGKKSFSAEHWDVAPQLEGKYNEYLCGGWGVIELDIDGNIIGKKVGTDLYPIPVDGDSFDVKYVDPTDAATSKLMVSFDYNRLMKSEELWLISADELGADLNDQDGLKDVELEFVSKTSTQVVVNATLSYGTAVQLLKVKGLLAADFALYNNTLGASHSITTVTEGTGANEGQYTITYVAITGSVDNLTLSMAKDGYVGKLDYVDA